MSVDSVNPKSINGSLKWKLWFVSNIKMMFTLTAVVTSDGREIGFGGLFLVREMLVSRAVAQKIYFLR
jgi:hypothetical protein